MNHDKSPLVVVLSRNSATGLSVIRSLGAAGYTVDLVASAYKAGKSEIAAASKYVRNSVEVVSKKVKDGGDYELLEQLLKYKDISDRKIVLFPTDDYTTSIIDSNRTILETIFIMPTIVGGGDGCLTERMDKTVQGNMARAAGIPTPKEWTISLEKDIELPDDIIYPCFCKPIESITGYKKEMAKCENEVELYRHLSKLKKKFANRSILVQEFLEIDSEIDFSGVCLDEEIIIPGIIRKSNVGQHEKGVTLSGNVYPFEEMGELQNNIVEMLKAFHYVGMFDMELNIVGDKIYFNEVNLRSGGPNYAYFASGVNLPALYVKEALGERHLPEEESVTEYYKSFIYEKVAWADYIYGYMTKQELDKCIGESDIMLLCNDDDPEPGKIFEKDIKLQLKKARAKAFKSKLKKIKKKIKKAIYPRLVAMKARALGYPQTKPENQRNPDSEKPRVIVTGRNYSSNLCMARSLGEAGYEVEVMHVFQKRPKRLDIMKALKPDAYSKYVKAYYVCISNRRSKRILKRLKRIADPQRKMLLIPTCDLLASVVDKYYDKLSEYYLLPNINETQGELSEMMSKEKQKELAIAAGLPVLNSCVITAEKGEFEIPESVTYPCFIKPNISKNSAKSRMRKCDCREELEEALTTFSRNKKIEMLVEDFVEIGKEYSLLGVSTKEGVNGPGFFVAEEGGQVEARGVALVGRVLDCDDWRELVDKMIRFVGSLNYTGLYDIDLIETADGKMYFAEVNLRFGSSGYAITQCGVNLPGMYADYMYEGKPIDTECKIDEPGKTFASEKVLIGEYSKGRISMDKVHKSMDAVDIHFVKNDQDIKPYKHFKRYYLAAKIMRLKNKGK